jgi:hypothetical protein
MTIQIYSSLQTCSYTCRRAASAAREEVRGARTWHFQKQDLFSATAKACWDLVCAAAVPASDRHERPTPSTLRAAIRVRHVACRKAVRRVLRNNCHPILSPFLPLIRRASGDSSHFRPLPPYCPWRMGTRRRRLPPPTHYTTSATGGSRVQKSGRL